MFTHLHNHTEYSMLDGISRIPDLVDRTVELGMSALAITDHGSLYGAVDFYSECKDRGIKPIIGCETYMAHESRFNRGAEERSPYHLVLLARDNQGYRNLMQLITLAHLEGFHYRPRVDRQILESHQEGLICLSGCASAEVPQLLAEENMDGARRTAGWYREIFGDGYFLELQQHEDVPKLDIINNGLITLSHDLNIPLVVTNDSHYVRQKDAEFQDIYICIQTNTNQQDEKRLRMKDDSYYIKSPDEMAALFPNYPEAPEALNNTQRIADMCNVELGFGQTHLPRYQTPSGIDADEYLAQALLGGVHHALRHVFSRGREENEVRAGSHPPHPVRQLLPGRVGHHRLRPPERDPIRSPGQRGGQRGPLLPGHHRHRPAGVPPGLRALPAPGAEGDAGHRHGLPGRPARRGAALRDRPVRQRQRRPNHHLRDHGRQGLPPGRRPRHGHELRGRGPDRPDGAAQVPHPGSRHEGQPGSQQRLPERGAGQDPGGQRDGPGGHRSPRQHPPSRGAHRRRTPDGYRAPAAAAQGRREQPSHDDPVLNGPRWPSSACSRWTSSG